MRKGDTEYWRYFPVSQRDRRWGLHVTGAGCAGIRPFWTEYPRRIHPEPYMYRWAQGRVLHEYQALYLLHGSGEFESAAAGPQSIKPGTLVLLFPGDWHRYRPDKETGWDEYWVSFAGGQMDHLLRGGFFSPSKPLLTIGAEPTVLQNYLDLVDLARAQPAGFQQLAAATVHQILAAGLAAVHRRDSSKQDEERVRQAKAYLEEHIEDTISIPQLASMAHITPRHLSRLFQRYTNMSPHEFFLQLKMRHAQRLLETNLTLKEIAHRLGFESPFHLSRTFKRRTGVSPKQWRNGL